MNDTHQRIATIAHINTQISDLRDMQRRLVRDLAAGGMPETRIAADTGLSRTTVRRWVGKP